MSRADTKTDKLLKAIESIPADKFGNPVSIRATALAERTGIDANSISGLLKPHVTSGRICMCKITVPGGRQQSEYRKGGGVAAPPFVPLKTGKRAGIALSTAGQRPRPSTSSKPQPAVGKETPAAGDPVPPRGEPAVAAPATPKPKTTARMNAAPAAPRASAGDVFTLTLDDTGVLIIATDEAVIELQPKHTQRLGHFMVNSERIWNPF